MKKLIFILFNLISLSASATIHTVSNIDSSAQFTTIQAACDASQSGDSIYVSPSIYNYDGFSINDKKLAVFGPGWNPFAGKTTNINGCSLNGIGASGSELHGLFFYSNISINTAGINDIIIRRNRITGIWFSGSVRDYIIEGNWFVGGLSNVTSAIFSDLVIRNNIFFECGLYGMYGDSTIIEHNLFYGRPYLVFGYSSHLIFSNNILQLGCANGVEGNSTNFSVFNNNITYGIDNIIPWNSNNNIDFGGNIAGKNPQMVDEASVDADVNDPLLDFTIKKGPANNAGSDGLDMGLLYDKGKVTNWNYSRAAHLPYISELNITDQNILIDGYIHFSGKAKGN